MRDGDRLIDRDYTPRLPRLSARQVEVAGTVWEKLSLYIVPLAAAASIGRTGEVIDVEWLRVFVTTFGTATFWLLFGCVAYGVFDYERRYNDSRPQPQPVPVQITHVEQRGEVTHSELHEYQNPPTADFIKWIWQSAGTDGRVPSERAAMAQWGTGANEWLSALEKEGFVEKTAGYENAPRRLVAGRTAEQAMTRFGQEG